MIIPHCRMRPSEVRAASASDRVGRRPAATTDFRSFGNTGSGATPSAPSPKNFSMRRRADSPPIPASGVPLCPLEIRVRLHGRSVSPLASVRGHLQDR